MSFLSVGVVGTSRKPNEGRVPIHPGHLRRIREGLRSYITFERGYGARFQVTDDEIEALGYPIADRRELLGSSEVVILPKETPEDLREIREGSAVWGWPHCVQQRDITQAAIDRRLTLVAWESMYHRGEDGGRQHHTFYKNNELAGYCSVLHALELQGRDGFYGPTRRAAILGFGSTGRGAVYALQGRGFTDILVYTQRPSHVVHDQQSGCRYRQMCRPTEEGGAMTAVLEDDTRRDFCDELARAEIIVNCTLQDTDDPLMYLRPGEEDRLVAGSVIIDVSCDEGMGFEFARPTPFTNPTFRVGPDERILYYAVDHSPSYLWDAASWEISTELLPFLEQVASGPAVWAAIPTLARAIEIRDGVVQNRKILNFQNRAAEYPHQPL